MLTDKEADAWNRTGMFLTLFDWTLDGNQIRRGLLIAAIAVLIATAFR